MRIGYARVSTQNQNPDLQLDALKKASCEEIFQEKFSGKSAARPELENCLRMLRKGDVLVVCRLDRLGRSLKDLVEIVSALEDRGGRLPVSDREHRYGQCRRKAHLSYLQRPC